MKIQSHILRKTAIAAAVFVAIGGISPFNGLVQTDTGFPTVVSTAYAGQGGGGHRGERGGMSENRDGRIDHSATSQGHRGGKNITELLSTDDGEDSDRPEWAGQPGGEGRPGGGGNPQPGVTKGDEFGDLIVLLRDPVTGAPILSPEGWLQLCTDPNCTNVVAMVDGEVPEGVTPIEVEFGRASIARAPDSVIDHALDEAISKLTADGAIIGQDEAGRITVTVDGVTSTIDSPLENLALYIDLMTGLADSNTTSQTETALGSLANLDVAAALLGGVADKTGDITLDYLVYENAIADIVKSGEYYDFSDFDYNRDYDNVTYFYTLDDGATVLKATLDVDAYLEAVNGALPTVDGAALFAAAADDAVEIIELIHTQIHYISEPLPGTQ